MSDTKHTPGPWSIGALVSFDGDDNEISSVEISGFGWRQFAKCIVKYGNEESEEGQANAQLIAAAPDLLEALETLLNASHPIIHRGKAVCADRIKAKRLARAAIAKAKGESHE